MSDSSKKITSFLSEYEKNKELVSLISSVNNKAYSDLKDDYKLLLENCRWLVQFYYIAHSTRDFTLKQLSLPLRNVSQLSVASSLRLFSKPNHKDRYTYLIFYLREHSDLFAQVIYFSLLAPSNPTLAYNDLKLLSQDDLIYFCFTTFPSIYNFFLTIEDQMAGISLISNLFSLHTSIHGMNFGKPHKFLSYLVTSLFLSTNPGTFFEMSVLPLIRQYGTKLEAVQFKYTKVGANLVREDYWTNLVDFTSQLISNLTKNAPLMPSAARFLITQIMKFNKTSFPFSELFIIDAMICDYLENRLLTAKTVLMHDVCNILRCGYPQTIISSPVSSTLNLLHLDLGQKINLNGLITSLHIEKVENDQLTQSIRTMEEMSLFSPRDLTLFHMMLSFFLKFANKEKVSELDSSFKGLTPPNSESIEDADDKVLCLKSWNSGLSRVTKITSKIFDTGRDFDEIIDCTASIDISKLTFNTAHELSQKALLFCGKGLNCMQKLRINNIKPDFENEVEKQIDSIKSSKKVVEESSDLLSTAIFALTAENQRNSNQIKRSIMLFLRVKFIPTLNELFSTPDSIIINNNFNVQASETAFQSQNMSILSNSNNNNNAGTVMVNINNLPTIQAENARIKLLLSVIEKLSQHFQLLKNQDALMKKEYATVYIDNRDKFQKFQESYKKNNEKDFQLIIQKVKQTLNSNNEDDLLNSRLTNEIVDCMNLISVKAPPSANLRTIVKIIRLMSRLSNDERLRVMAKSDNVDVFAFAEFVKNHIINNDKLADVMLTKNESNCIHQFLTIIDRLKLMK